MKRLLITIATAAFALAIPLLVQAADWPTRPVRIIVPWAAGGSADALGRIFGEQLSQAFHQSFVVENQGGAGGLIGSMAVTHADPDGYTFLVSGIGSCVIAPKISGNPGYDPIRDFTNIAYFGGAPIVMVAHPSLGVKSLKELLELAKNSKEPLAYVSPGTGSLGNMIAEYFARRQKIKLEHIPYKGGAQAVTDLIGGHVKVGSMTLTVVSALIHAGNVIPLAVSSATRLAEFPDLPTFKELGYPDLVATTWFSLSAPKGLPNNIVQAVNREVDKAKDDPEVQKRLAIEAIQTEKMSPAEFTKFLESELVKWGPVAKEVIKANSQ